MKNTLQDSKSPVMQVENRNTKQRIFARTVSRQLTKDDLKRVSGGSDDCTRTSYPNADVVCDL